MDTKLLNQFFFHGYNYPWFARRVIVISEEHTRNGTRGCLGIHVIPVARTVRSEGLHATTDVIRSMALAVVDRHRLKL